MSSAVRVALVAEGPTDAVVVEAGLRAILVNRPFVLTQLQPEQSLAFGPLGTGWGGVYRWCKQKAREAGGHLRDFRLLFDQYDLVVLQVDADVARAQYAEAGITPDAQDGVLPCEVACPPVSDTTDALRRVLLSWCGETAPPPKTVLCTPSKSTDTWVVAALYPNDAAVKSKAPFECHADAAARLSQQSKTRRIRKTQAAYRDNAGAITANWRTLGLTEVARFDAEVNAVLPA